ncbi:MAG: hypothetical protein OER21_13795 [Gemmatimonadota bacterium]|nr:hypothetical protein [Gemmatimonadota bacterium]
MSFHGVPQGVTSPPAPASAGEDESHKTPGTLVLVFVFLAAFVVYYFVNWKLLSFLWRIG